LIGDLHEWDNETAAVPTCCLANTQQRERALMRWRGEKTPLSSALASSSGTLATAELVGSASTTEKPTRVQESRLPLGGHGLVRSLAGAARLRHYSEGAQRFAPRGQKPRLECKGKSKPQYATQHVAYARKCGLTILGRPGNGGRGVGKVTAGITGLWPFRVHIYEAF